MEREERRKYPRFPVYYDLLYKKTAESNNNKKQAIVENVSRTGVKIRTSGILKKDDELELTIYKSPNATPIGAHGRVVWYKESPFVYGEKLAGIFFTKIGWTESGKLINKYYMD